MNIQTYKRKGKYGAYKFAGRCGLHIYSRSVGRRIIRPFILILPLLWLDWGWVIQDDNTDHRYYSVRFGWIIWEGAFYFRGRKSRIHTEHI